MGAATARHSPAGCARVKGGGTSYTLTTAPDTSHALPPMAGDQGLPASAWQNMGCREGVLVGAEHWEVLGGQRRKRAPLWHPP